MNRRTLFFLVALAGMGIWLWRCDAGKFTGFNYDADRVADSARVSGTVSNLFTRQPVAQALVNIGELQTATDSLGRYNLDFPLSGDVNRNKQISVHVTKDKFYPFDTEIIIFPLNNLLNVDLRYGAPIPRRAVLLDTICQAIIFDYQGIADVDSVTALLRYVLPRVFGGFVAFPMQQVAVIGDSVGYYQVTAPPFIRGKGNLMTDTYFIRAVDKEGFKDKIVFQSTGQDTLLFSP